MESFHSHGCVGRYFIKTRRKTAHFSHQKFAQNSLEAMSAIFVHLYHTDTPNNSMNNPATDQSPNNLMDNSVADDQLLGEDCSRITQVLLNTF